MAKKENDNLEQLRTLTRRQVISIEKLQRDRDEFRELLRIAWDGFKERKTCPSKQCEGTGQCQFCKRVPVILKETE